MAAAIASGDAAAVSAWHESEQHRMMRVAVAVVRDRQQAAEIVQ